jgi:hypothetical protein
MKPRVSVRAVATVAAIAVLLLLPLAGTASADLSGPCKASAVIDGVTYTTANDTEDNPVVIPDKEGLIANWEGKTTVPITDHMGEIYVAAGPAKIPIDDWGEPNKPKPTKKSKGMYNIDEAREDAFKVVGLYRVEGNHKGEGGSCEGFVMVKIEGNPLGTVPGAVSAGGTLLAAGGLIAAARAKKGGLP